MAAETARRPARKVGRHFRLSFEVKAVVGRNQEGNHRILALAKKKDILLKVQDCGSPVTLLQGEAGAEEISLANAITARYSDAQGAEVAVHYGTSYATLGEAMLVSSSDKDELTRLPI